MAKKEKEEEKLSFTISGCYANDKIFLLDLASEERITVAQALRLVINNYKNPKKSDEENLLKEIEELKQKIASSTAKLEFYNQEKEDVKNQLQSKIDEKEKTITELNEAIEKLKNSTPELKLIGTQFICEIEMNTALKARKIRSFALQDKIVTTTKGNEYIQQLVNRSLESYINLKYDHIL